MNESKIEKQVEINEEALAHIYEYIDREAPPKIAPVSGVLESSNVTCSSSFYFGSFHFFFSLIYNVFPTAKNHSIRFSNSFSFRKVITFTICLRL